MTTTVPTIDKMTMKAMTRKAIEDAFVARGCTTSQKTAGAVKYTPISFGESDQRLAAIYGSKGGAASVWIKEETWTRLRPHVNPDNIRVEDVDLFGRGFQWAVHFDHHDDPLILHLADIAVECGTERWERAKMRREADSRRESIRAEREAEMAERKRDPFA